MIGGWFTILFGLIVVALFMGFGIDLYERQKPQVSLNTEIGEYQRMKLSNDNFTFAYRIEDSDSNYFYDESFLHINLIWYYYLLLPNGTWTEVSYGFLDKKHCTDFPWAKAKEQAYNISLHGWDCIDFTNMTVGGNWDGDFVYGLRIDTVQCVNSTSSNITCRPFDEIENKFESGRNTLFFSYLYLDEIPAMDNFTSPLKTTLINTYDILSVYMTKRNVQTFKTVQVNNDVGWFFSDVNLIQIISNDNIAFDLSIKNAQNQTLLYTYLAYWGRRIETYNRTYTKIQEVFAAIGGFTKFFYTIIYFVYSFYSTIFKNMHLLQFLNQKDELELLSENEKKFEFTNNTQVNKTLIMNNNLINATETKIFSTVPDANMSSNIINLNKSDMPKHVKSERDNIINNSMFNTLEAEKRLNLDDTSLLFKYKYFRCCMSRKLKSKLAIQNKLYDSEKKCISYLFDAVHFIKFQQEYENLKKMLFNAEQQILLSLIKNQMLPNEMSMKSQIERLKEFKGGFNLLESDSICQKALDLMGDERKTKLKMHLI